MHEFRHGMHSLHYNHPAEDRTERPYCPHDGIFHQLMAGESVSNEWTRVPTKQIVLTSLERVFKFVRMRSIIHGFHPILRISGRFWLVALFLGLAVAAAVEMSAGGCLGVGNTTGTSFAGISVFERQPGAGETESPSLGPCASPRLPDAWVQTDSTPQSRDLKHSEPGVSLVPRGGLPDRQLSLLRFRHLSSRRAVCPQPPLEVLFCTWQI